MYYRALILLTVQLLAANAKKYIVYSTSSRKRPVRVKQILTTANARVQEVLKPMHDKKILQWAWAGVSTVHRNTCTSSATSSRWRVNRSIINQYKYSGQAVIKNVNNEQVTVILTALTVLIMKNSMPAPTTKHAGKNCTIAVANLLRIASLYHLLCSSTSVLHKSNAPRCIPVVLYCTHNKGLLILEGANIKQDTGTNTRRDAVIIRERERESTACAPPYAQEALVWRNSYETAFERPPVPQVGT